MNWAKGRKTGGRGTSFKGTLLYQLHDKGADTSHRVGHVEMINMAENDPHRAWREMKALCDASDDLKRENSIPLTGRKLQQPVYTFSLNWHEDDKPGWAHMRATALEVIEELGMSHHQAVIVEHRDTAHRHVHITLNLVDPHTGKAASLSNDGYRLDRWADTYELRMGVVRSPDRRAKFAALDQGLKPPRRQCQPKSREEYQATKNNDQAALGAAAAVRAALSSKMAALRASQQDPYKARRAESEKLWKDYRAARKAVMDRHAGVKAPSPPRTPRQILDELTAQKSTFTRRDLARYLNERTKDAEQFKAALARIEASRDLVKLAKGPDGQDRYTSRDMQAVERRMVDHAVTLHERHGHGAAASLRARSVAFAMTALGQDQQDAVRHVTGKEGIACVVGFSGSGKSTMLKVARQAWEHAGYRVRGAALQALAAEGLQQGAGINSGTLHSLLFSLEKGHDRLTAKDVLVVDEAGMIGSRMMEKLLGHARGAGAKVVLVGDYNQLQSIEAGAAFRAIVDRIGAARLTEIRRQKEVWQRQATREFAQNRVDAALKRYDDAGMVHGHDTKGDAKKALIERWAAARAEKPGLTQMILAYTRADVKDLNERARQVRRQAGDLGDDRILKTSQGKRAFATSDRLYFTKNDRKMGVRNGTLGTIEAIDGQKITVRLDDATGGRITFSMADYADIDHGYAATVHKSQGATVDRTHVLATRHMDRHAAYVAMSRHRDRVDVHWSADSIGSRARLASTFARDGAKDVTLDYGQGDKTKTLRGINPREAGVSAAEKARNAELAALADTYQRDRAAMKARHDAEISEERAAWQAMTKERDTVWADHKRRHPLRRNAGNGLLPAFMTARGPAVAEIPPKVAVAPPPVSPAPPPVAAALVPEPPAPEIPEQKAGIRTGWRLRRSAAERKQDGSYKPRQPRGPKR